MYYNGGTPQEEGASAPAKPLLRPITLYNTSVGLKMGRKKSLICSLEWTQDQNLFDTNITLEILGLVFLFLGCIK